ncbi:MAG: efflux RND transporter periplasmic adaptor subunit [Candidatus Omnitrophota bacterium]
MNKETVNKLIKDSKDKIKNSLLPGLKKNWRWVVGGLIIGIIFAMMFSAAGPGGAGGHTGHEGEEAAANKIKYWTCSMHPQIKLPKPGKCPICAMDLIPVYESGTGGGKGEEVSLTLNTVGRQLAEIETAPVEHREVFNEIRLVGKVDYDESRLSYISAWVAGRIDKLYVDFTGTRVRKGDHLIYLYSPELLATQEEYIQAIKNLKDTEGSQLSVIRDTAGPTLKSAKEKLRLYGITPQQIEDIAARGTAEDHMTIYSPVSGTVIHKNGFEGMYVKTGDKIYAIADLSKVWLFLDAYESDIQWIHYGQNISIEAEGYPGEIFYGKIAFIEPFVNKKTRTIKLRVNVDNKDEKLKPDMFVRATIKSVLGEGGKVYEADLAGKWICPMHPDVVKDAQAKCDICGMDLIPTSEFGFANEPMPDKKVLVIPRTAPLITGKRAIVYVENETEKGGINRYEGREIVLGPRAGDSYAVLSGLKEGERVVTQGNFKIDSALQILAKPSMMNPAGYYHEGEGALTAGATGVTENVSVLTPAIPYYLAAWRALSNDNAEEAGRNLNIFKEKIELLIEEGGFKSKDKGIAVDIKALQQKISVIKNDISSLRELFSEISVLLKKVFEKYSYTEKEKLYLIYCSMSFDGKGGYWFQDSKEIKNPYLGSKMLTCGEEKAEYGRKIIERKPMPAGHNH